jgi:hypothetical protein
MRDTSGRRVAVFRSPGNVADISVAPALLAATPGWCRRTAVKGEGADPLKKTLAAAGTEAVTP